MITIVLSLLLLVISDVCGQDYIFSYQLLIQMSCLLSEQCYTALHCVVVFLFSMCVTFARL